MTVSLTVVVLLTGLGNVLKRNVSTFMRNVEILLEEEAEGTVAVILIAEGAFGEELGSSLLSIIF